MTRRTRSNKLNPPQAAETTYEAEAPPPTPPAPPPPPPPVKARGHPHKAVAAAGDNDQPLAVPSQDTSVPQPKTKGRGLKRAAPALPANNNEETCNIPQDDDYAPPTKKLWNTQAAAKSVKSKAHKKPVESCEPLPTQDGRNTHPGLIEGVAPAHRHTTAEVSAERAAAWKAAEDEICCGEEAKPRLAEMEVDEEQENAEDEEKSTRRLSAVLKNAYCPHADDAESFDWNSGEESDSEPEVEQG